MTREELTEFEEEIKNLFLDKKILSPIHLSRGNEDQLINIFKNIVRSDWVFSTHRSHYHALLKGVPKEWLRQEILENRSIHIFNNEYNFFSSAIVGGCLPIAVGVAMGMKIQKSTSKVWIFVGDMASETGAFHECVKYAGRNNLPITFIIEDNGLSTDTPTQKVWGLEHSRNPVTRYYYERELPHVGAGEWVSF